MHANRFGGGARTNENGLRFEQETSLEDALINAGYTITSRGIVLDCNNRSVGLIAPKYSFYSKILVPEGIRWQNYISKQLLPDEALLNFANNTVYIIEKKFQNRAGSVDEKLQTCDFKKKQYQKLLRDTDYEVEYLYVCNEWFMHPCYRDVYEYILESGCHIFFNEIPLEFLQLPL